MNVDSQNYEQILICCTSFSVFTEYVRGHFSHTGNAGESTLENVLKLYFNIVLGNRKDMQSDYDLHIILGIFLHTTSRSSDYYNIMNTIYTYN